MNERLRQELESIELMGSSDSRDITYVAKHFYNLALEDVRKEVARRRIQAEYKKTEAIGVGHDGYCMNLAVENECMFILDFINNLTK